MRKAFPRPSLPRVVANRSPVIAVIGGSSADERATKLAEEVGFLIARAGATLVCGGLTGVMEAACRGARRGGGLTVGILPTDSKADANPHVDLPIVTAIGTARNVIVVRTGDAIIAVDGSYGTLSEMAHAFDLGKKVFALQSWPLDAAGVPKDRLIVVHTPREAVDRALEEARKSGADTRP